MKELLLAISILSIQSGDAWENASKFQIENQWLGFEPANTEDVREAERRLHVNLPEDYKTFLQITNGFSAPNTVEPTFMKVDEIDYLNTIDPDLVKIWDVSNNETGNDLKKSLLIAGKGQEQYFLLVPVDIAKGKWKYWKFANWHPGEQEYKGLKDYFKDVLKFCEQESLNNSK
ncbi:SMI1/KNR4 family protein [Chryseobacterium hagamense]|uniref:Knr4/Smi1-like domain-containing protein n=1 Tax=Chryseobacterium hagamense TaxID=395935 RepID=A0A511YNC7_9FLAO|nr:SMI1/KNR4 family protein [Chryseobacterium hagamense]GEN76691.1 hypothetical protein CHA01nite_24310 [Chryseobacterium hagamense]